VVPPFREGGQKQFVDAPVAPDAGEHALTVVLDRFRTQLSEVHTIESMAGQAQMSKRTFARRFKAVTGASPHRWLQKERVRLVQDLLETTSLSLDLSPPSRRSSDKSGPGA
jgi:AraC family transcriptional activator FtrA